MIGTMFGLLLGIFLISIWDVNSAVIKRDDVSGSKDILDNVVRSCVYSKTMWVWMCLANIFIYTKINCACAKST